MARMDQKNDNMKQLMTYEYQQLVYHSEMDISFPDWLNEKCTHWEIIHIEVIKGVTLYRLVTMRRFKLINEK